LCSVADTDLGTSLVIVFEFWRQNSNFLPH
jgi:hypothetical protein